MAGWPGFGIRAREPERSTSPEPIHSGMNHSAGIATAQATSSARSCGRRRHSTMPKASRNGHASTRSSAQPTPQASAARGRSARQARTPASASAIVQPGSAPAAL